MLQQKNSQTKGVLLVNLGTPTSPSAKDVYRYLSEFLTDPRVITLPWISRQLLVRGIIIPKRVFQSAAQYQSLWTEEGSPLMVHGKAVEKKLQTALGSEYKVVLAMRYQQPSIKLSLQQFEKLTLESLTIIPLFPQYASATTGSVHEEVMLQIKKWNIFPKITFINHYFDHPFLINAFCARILEHDLTDYDKILFSFHGLPETQIKQSDKIGCCLKASCCETKGPQQGYCYKAQCYATARAIVEKLNLASDKYQISFQSRLGKEPWIEPYTAETIHAAAKKGVKKMLVVCPAFICDCLETLYEIKQEYAKEFSELGGEKLELVVGLNDHPAWIEALKQIIYSH